MNNTNLLSPLPNGILDEIGLEGLDGITLEGLWKRLSVRRKLQLPLNSNFCDTVWKFILQQKCLQFYRLHQPRKPLILFDRTEFVDPDIRMPTTEALNVPFTIYKYNPIQKDDIRGSCEDYDTRVELKRKEFENLSLDEIENKYGQTFIIVGSQKLRESCLISSHATLEKDCNIIIYCLLERIGRSRYNGEITQGKFSLNDITNDSVKLFYMRKLLLKEKLVAKQMFTERINDNTVVGSLLHLPRFFIELKSKFMVLTEQVCNILKSSPHGMAESSVIRSHFDKNLEYSLIKLFKMSLFQKYVITDSKVPFRKMYPNATLEQWQNKIKEERQLKVFQLRDINININDMWPNEKDEEENGKSQEPRGFLNSENQCLHVPIATQIYNVIANSKCDGISSSEIGKYLGLNRLNIRAILKHLHKSKIIDFYFASIGRQKTSKYILPIYANMLPKEQYDDEEFELNMDHPTGIVIKTELNDRNDETILCGNRTVDNNDDDVDHVNDDVVLEYHGDNTNNTNNSITNTNNNMNNDNNSINLRREDLNADDKAIYYLPQILKAKYDDNVLVDIKQIQEPPGCVKSKRYCPANEMTARMKFRFKIILQLLQKNHIIDDLTSLFTIIIREELRRGFQSRMCKKTLNRLLSRLSYDKLICIWSITLRYNKKERELLFLTNLNIEPNNTLFQSFLEQSKTKFIMQISNNEINPTNNNQNDLNTIENTLHTQTTTLPYIVNNAESIKQTKLLRNDNRMYGTVPKFIRLRTLHEFIYYMVYDYPNHNNISNVNDDLNVISINDAIKHWKTLNPFIDYDDLVGDVPTIYSTEINWKMFLPPLLKHKGYPNGWCLLNDLLLRLPLSIFIKIININTIIPNLNEFLSHPIRKHYLVKYLPNNIRTLLLLNRRYVYAIDDDLHRLCSIGLIQFGTNILREKEHTFIYLNRNSKLLNTTTSLPDDLHSTNIEYDILRYQFNTFDDVTKYWTDLYRICLNTKLKRTAYDEHVHNASQTSILKNQQCYRQQTVQQANINDDENCKIPGDNLGVAGLDSSLFAHYPRNWIKKRNPKFRIKTNNKHRTVIQQPIRFNKFMQRTNNLKTIKRKCYIFPVKKNKSKGKIMKHRVLIQSNRRSRKQHYDEIDKQALKLMIKLRVTWNPIEDNLIMLCKIAILYLYPSERKHLTNFGTVRDILHWSCKSYNKTARACQRRMVYRMKNPDIVSSVYLCLEEIRQNKDIERQYGLKFIYELEKYYSNQSEFEQALRIHFIDFVYMLSKIFVNFSTNSSTMQVNTLQLPKTLLEYKQLFVEKAEHYNQHKLIFDNPRTKREIQIITLTLLIHSSMCCVHDKTSWNIQLFDIYKNYSEDLLTAAMKKVRKTHLISTNKITTFSNRNLPLSSSPYHLSSSYFYQILTKISYDIFGEAYFKLRELFEYPKLEYSKCAQTNSGVTFLLSELIVSCSIDIKINLPEKILVPDETIRTVSTNEDRFRKRFTQIFDSIEKVDIDIDHKSLEIEQKSNISQHKYNSSSIGLKQANNADAPMEQLLKLNIEHYHFFCLLKKINSNIDLNKFKLFDNEHCEFKCIRKTSNMLNEILNVIKTNQSIIIKIFNNNNNNNSSLTPIPSTSASSLVNLIEVNTINFIQIYVEFLKENVMKINEIQNIKEIIMKIIKLYELFTTETESTSTPKSTIELEQTHSLLSKSGTIPVAATALPEDDENDDLIENDFSEYSDLKLDSIHCFDDKIHRYHDLLYVKPCEILICLNDKFYINQLNRTNGIESILPLYEIRKNQVLQLITKNSVWSQDHGTKDDFCNELNKRCYSMEEQIIAKDILNCIEQTKDVGVINFILKQRFDDNIELLMKIIELLIDLNLIMKTGVKDYTFVFWKYVQSWLVESYHIKRLDRESIKPCNYKLMNIDDNSSANIQIEKSLLSSSQSQSYSSPSPSTSTSSTSISKSVKRKYDSDNNNTITAPKMKRSKRIANNIILKDQQLQEIHQPKSKELIYIKMNPWVRVNGSLNRRVLDKWMGSILTYCISHPGVLIGKLCIRFNYLQPTNVREILEYLQILECIEMFYVTEPVTTIFNDKCDIKIESATQFHAMENISVNVLTDAVLKMSYFIGDKKYDADFI